MDYDYTTTSKSWIAGKWMEMDDHELVKLHEEVYDRWNFETGSDEDLELMKELEKEIRHRKCMKECIDALCKEDYIKIMNSLGDTYE